MTRFQDKKPPRKAGMTDHGLYNALRKPHVAEYKNRVLREYRESLAENALVRVEEMSRTAKKESVKLSANKTLLEQDQRFIPATKVQHSGSIEHKVTPGYVIDITPHSKQLNNDQVIEHDDNED